LLTDLYMNNRLKPRVGPVRLCLNPSQLPVGGSGHRELHNSFKPFLLRREVFRRLLERPRLARARTVLASWKCVLNSSLIG
jgi:hypothetical protein